MRVVLATSNLERYVCERWGVAGELWLGGLDEMVERTLADFDLVGLGVHPQSNRSLVVLAVHATWGRVAVKFDPAPDAAAAFEALDVWASRGAAPACVGRRPGVDVRVWSDGLCAQDVISEGVDPFEVTVSVFEALTGTVPALASFRCRADVVADEAMSAVGRIAVLEPVACEAADAVLGDCFSERWLLDAAADLGVSASGTCLCHGDLTPRNVLWVAGQAMLIDPEPAVGSLYADAARWALRTHLAVDVSLTDLVEVASTVADLDRATVWETARFSAVTYAAYTATFGRGVDERLAVFR